MTVSKKATQGMWAALPERVIPARILVVDDDRTGCRMLKAALQSRGWQAVTVFSAPEAFEVLRRSIVDLVVCDFRMPGMDGISFFMEVRASSQLREIPFVFLSAYADPTDRVAALRHGAEDFLMKPISVDELAVRVQHALVRRQARLEMIRHNQAVLQGSLVVFRLDAVLSLLEKGRQTGVLQVTLQAHVPGFIYLEGGRLRGAKFGAADGVNALVRLLELPGGNFDFYPSAPQRKTYTFSMTLDEAIREWQSRVMPTTEMPGRGMRIHKSKHRRLY